MVTLITALIAQSFLTFPQTSFGFNDRESPIIHSTKLINMRVLFCFIALGLSCSVFCQRTDSIPYVLKDDLLKKSHTQKKTAVILLTAGAAFIATSLLIPEGASEGLQLDPIFLLTEKHKNDDIKAIFGVIGTLSAVASIPFFSAASKSKKKAMSLSLKSDAAPQLYKNSLVKTSYPAISCKLSF